MTDYCQEHVWDNGDTTSCGSPVVCEGMCDVHVHLAVQKHQRLLKEHETAMEKSRAILAKFESCKFAYTEAWRARLGSALARLTTAFQKDNKKEFDAAHAAVDELRREGKHYGVLP